MKRLLIFLMLICTGFSSRAFNPMDTSGIRQEKKTVKAKRNKNTGKIQYGTASYYHSKFEGRKTSSGQLYDGSKYTAAHNGLPLNTWIKVTNLRNKRSVIVKVNDRLHHKNDRIVDLSRVAAQDLGYLGRGLTRVKVEVLGKKKPAAPKKTPRKTSGKK
jgi:rare lipoprotein A